MEGKSRALESDQLENLPFCVPVSPVCGETVVLLPGMSPKYFTADMARALRGRVAVA